MKIDTEILHLPNAPHDPHKSDGAPLYNTAGFHIDLEHKNQQPYIYSRIDNPTRTILQTQLAKLDHACYSHATTSGLAALAIIISILNSGDEIIFNHSVYGGTYSLLKNITQPKGIKIKQIDMRDLSQISDAITPHTKLILMESPSNPDHHVCDIRAIVSLAKQHEIYTAIDNSVISSYFQQPLSLGVDFTIQSATKYLSGHGDITAGVISVSTPENEALIKSLAHGLGNALAPHDCWLLHRSIKTLGLRLRQQQASAIKVAELLEKHSIIKKVNYLGLPSHPQHTLHISQAKGFGSILSFQTPSLDFSKKLIKHASAFFKVTASFGSVSSSISLPSEMSHYAVFGCEKAVKSFSSDLVRLSIGVEDTDDILEALSLAIDKTM